MNEADRTRLQHMLDAAEKAEQFAQDKQRNDLEQDEVLCLALVRLLEIIGEAANRVTTGTQQQFPMIPWSKIVGMRNRLIHGYDVIDLDILWQTIEQDVPQLTASLRDIIPSD